MSQNITKHITHCIQYISQNSRKRPPKLLKILHIMCIKETEKSFSQTNGQIGPEHFRKWANSLTSRRRQIWWWSPNGEPMVTRPFLLIFIALITSVLKFPICPSLKNDCLLQQCLDSYVFQYKNGLSCFALLSTYTVVCRKQEQNWICVHLSNTCPALCRFRVSHCIKWLINFLDKLTKFSRRSYKEDLKYVSFYDAENLE